MRKEDRDAEGVEIIGCIGLFLRETADLEGQTPALGGEGFFEAEKEGFRILADENVQIPRRASVLFEVVMKGDAPFDVKGEAGILHDADQIQKRREGLRPPLWGREDFLFREGNRVENIRAAIAFLFDGE